MAAETYDFIIKQGATFRKVIVWQDSNEVAYDLAGYTAKMQLRKYAGGEVVKELNTENNAITITPEAGSIQLELSATETLTLPVTKFKYDLLLINGSEVIPFLEGYAIVEENITVIV